MTLRQLLRKPFVSSPAAIAVDLTGKHMIVTGCGKGSLGYETALQLAAWGATVIVTTRSSTPEIIEALKTDLTRASGTGRLDGHNLDLSDTASVDQFSCWFQQAYGDRLDCLVNNGGVHLDLMSDWKQPNLTADGHEVHWRTNYLGTVQLTDRLLPTLLKTGNEFGEARVVNVVSQLHSRGNNALLFDGNREYESWQAYGLSKLALVHFTLELDRRLALSGNLKSFCLHPGGKSGAYTNVADKGLEGHILLAMLRKLGAPLEKLFMATAQEGAQTQIYCATATGAQSGQYYVNCQPANASDDSYDCAAARRLWQDTEQWLATSFATP